MIKYSRISPTKFHQLIYRVVRRRKAARHAMAPSTLQRLATARFPSFGRWPAYITESGHCHRSPDQGPVYLPGGSARPEARTGGGSATAGWFPKPTSSRYVFGRRDGGTDARVLPIRWASHRNEFGIIGRRLFALTHSPPLAQRISASTRPQVSGASAEREHQCGCPQGVAFFAVKATYQPALRGVSEREMAKDGVQLTSRRPTAAA